MVVNRRDPSLCRPMRSGRAACSATAAFEALFVVSVDNFPVPIIICRPVACFEFCDADKAGNAIRVWFTDDRSETRCGEHCPVQPFLICCFMYVGCSSTERVCARVVNRIGRFFSRVVVPNAHWMSNFLRHRCCENVSNNTHSVASTQLLVSCASNTLRYGLLAMDEDTKRIRDTAVTGSVADSMGHGRHVPPLLQLAGHGGHRE